MSQFCVEINDFFVDRVFYSATLDIYGVLLLRGVDYPIKEDSKAFLALILAHQTEIPVRLVFPELREIGCELAHH